MSREFILCFPQGPQKSKGSFSALEHVDIQESQIKDEDAKVSWQLKYIRKRQSGVVELPPIQYLPKTK